MVDAQIKDEIWILTDVASCQKNEQNCGMNQQVHIQKNDVMVVIKIEYKKND